MRRNEDSARALRMYNLDEFLGKKFNQTTFHGEWRDLIGNPVLTGIWFINGNSSNGKTTGAIKLAKYLTRYLKLIYWSKEEDASATLQMAFNRVGMEKPERRKIFIPQRGETLEGVKKKLREPKGPTAVFFDSVQIFQKKYGSDFFYELKEEFAGTKLLVFISQAEGKNPKGSLADDIKYDADVKMWVEGHRMFAESRVEGSISGSYVTTWEKKALEYWGAKK